MARRSTKPQWLKAIPRTRRLLRRFGASTKEVIQRATAPAHPYIKELLAYLRFLHSEGQENVLLRHIGPPHQMEHLFEILIDGGDRERVDTIVVSDLHLGSKLSLAHALSKALDRFSFKRLILNGDSFDHLDLERTSRVAASHLDLLEDLHALSATHEVVWIEGNHDEGLSEFLERAHVRVRRDYEWTYRGKRYLALHGDQFDTFYHEHPLLYAIGAGFYMMVQRLGPWSRRFCWFLKRTTKLYTHAITSSIRGALKHAREREVDYVFCGHTHHVHQETDGRVRYYNSGGWTESPCHLIAIGENGIRIHAFSETGDYIGSLSPLERSLPRQALAARGRL